MRNIVLIRSTYSAFGGVERVTLGLARGLLEKGIAVTLLTLPHQRWPLTHRLLNVIPLGILHTHRLIQAWSFNRSVCHFLARNPYDCILSLDRVTRFTHLHAGGGTHKSFLQIQNSYTSAFNRFFRRLSLFHRYTLYLERQGFINPLLQKIRCNSSLVKEDILRDYDVAPEKLVVIHSGIRWNEMADSFNRREMIGAELCRGHQLQPNWKMLLFLGSGFARKGLDIAIQGLQALPPDFHLVVVGKGRTRPYAQIADKAGYPDRVHFLGPQAQGWRYGAMCKALVLPSRYDPFGGAAAEGHAMGLPVLVSDKTGYKDRIEHGVNGVILKTPMTPVAISRAFSDLAGLIDLPQWTADQYRRHARQMDDDAILEQLLNDFLPE